MRIPAAFAGITSLKPTAGRLPLTGQGSDGGMIGVVGLCNTVGFMARSAEAIEDFAKEILAVSAVDSVTEDARFVPIPWREHVALRDKKKLRIGW